MHSLQCRMKCIFRNFDEKCGSWRTIEKRAYQSSTEVVFAKFAKFAEQIRRLINMSHRTGCQVCRWKGLPTNKLNFLWWSLKIITEVLGAQCNGRYWFVNLFKLCSFLSVLKHRWDVVLLPSSRGLFVKGEQFYCRR